MKIHSIDVNPLVAGSRGLTALLVLFALGTLAAVTVQAEDWPIFLGAERNAQSTEKLFLPWPTEGPKVLWTAQIHDSYAAPTVADGSVFLFDREGDQARLSRLDARNGKTQWASEYKSVYKDQFDFGGGPRVAPLFDRAIAGAAGEAGKDRVYAFGVDGKLRCHDAASGAVIWEHDTESKFGVVQNFFGVGSGPVVYADMLLVSIGGSPEGDWDNHERRIEANGTGLVAFDKLTGEIMYQALNDLASYSSLVVAKLGGKDRLISFARSGVWIVDPATGQVLAEHPWRAKKPYSVNAATPLIVGDEIFVSESYEKGGLLLRWVSAQGTQSTQGSMEGRLEVVWKDHEVLREQSLATHWNTPIMRDGVLYGSHGEKSGSAELRAVDWRTGEVRWKHRGLNRSNTLYADGHLVVLGEYGEIVVVEATAEEYREKQRFKLAEKRGESQVPLLKHPSWNAPVLANGVLYVAGADRLVALQLAPR